MDYQQVLDTAADVLEDNGYDVTDEYTYGSPGSISTLLDVDLGDKSKVGGEVLEDLMAEGVAVSAIMPWGHRKHQHKDSRIVQEKGDDVDSFVRLWFRAVEAEMVTKVVEETHEELEVRLVR